MKHLVALFLACAMLLFLPACGGEQNSQQSTSEMVTSEGSDEVSRAISYGLVPEEIQEDYDAGITFRQYSQMLTNLISIWDKSRLGEWEKTIALAAESDEEMQREDGILATAYAMVLMEQNAPENFFHLDIEPVMEQLDSNSDTPTWDYPLFPGWEETGFAWCDGNYMWGGLTTCAVMISQVSGQAIYPYDFEGKSAHLQDPLTREEAICAVLRLGELSPATLEPEGVYMQLSDVGTYDKGIITDDLLNAESDLPEVTQAQLPAEWKGAGLGSSKNDGGSNFCTDFRETDIQFLADNGFNFARIFFSFSTLRFPDYPEDGRLVNENELRDLDQLIAWGMEYGVHIQIAMSFYLDEGGNDKTDDSIASNDAQWAMVQDYWTMLARRYAGIPSRYLTFDLSNEIQPGEEDNLAYAESKLSELVSAVRMADAQRVLLHAFPANPNPDWVQAVASIGVGIGCHPYYPQYIATTGYEYAEQNPYAVPSWPQPWFPMGMVQDGAVPLVIQGDLSGAALSLHVWDGMEGTEISVRADGAPVETVVLSGGGTEETVTLQQISPQYQGALVVCSGGEDPQVRLRLVEAVSAHPLANAITAYAQAHGFGGTARPERFENLSGRGLRAELDGETVLAGNRRLLEEQGVDVTPLASDAERLAAQGQTPMYFARGGALLGLISVADPVKETSAAARLIALTASMTGLPFFRYFTKLITAIVMAKKV